MEPGVALKRFGDEVTRSLIDDLIFRR